MSRLHRRLVDWRFWTALAGTLLVVWLVVSSAQAFKAKDDQIDALIRDGRQDRQEAGHAAAQASQERDRLLAQQGRLVRLYRDLRTSQETLLAYLRRQGIALPENLEPVSPSANKQGATPATPADPHSVPTEHKPRPPRPGPPDGPSPPPGGPAPPPPPGPGDILRDLLPEGLLP